MLLLASSIGSLSEVWSEFQRAAGAGDRVVELLKTKPQITAPVNPVPMPTPARGAIRFDNVTFYYPTRPGVAALQGFNLEVRAGETWRKWLAAYEEPPLNPSVDEELRDFIGRRKRELAA